MASSSDPLLADPERPPTSSSYASSSHFNAAAANERTSLLPNFRYRPALPKINFKPTLPSFPKFNVSRPTFPSLSLNKLTPALPFTTTFYPTLYTRSLSLFLLFPPFILFTLLGPSYSPVIVFLSFALARQLWILVAHFSTRIIVIRIEVVNPRLREVRAKVQEKWVKRGIALLVDGGILVGLLVTLSLVAWGVDNCGGRCKVAEAGVVLGFLGFGLLLLSISDFGNPELVNMGLSIEKPANGILKWATSLEFGEVEENEAEVNHEHGKGRSSSRVDGEDIV